ncbi:chromosome segregation protein, putative [Babesia ovis]|uniref:Chromosome segregation protein, putative n=1 Tax=Babesia ovis TaxID=5869 RepID=A0A9W5T8I7_BABOV|nr:chromosome segregation protein, putative [Babesia ovis]
MNAGGRARPLSAAVEQPAAEGNHPPVSDSQTPSKSSEEPIYYLYGDDVNWWDEEPSAPSRPVEEQWAHPPPRTRLQEAINRQRGTHIVSPFKYLRYPHEFKTEAYERYQAPAPSDDKGGPETVQEVAFHDPHPSTGPTTKNVNIELRPVKQPETISKPRKSLRERLRDGEVVFYEDYVEREVTRDFCRLFQRPFPVPRHDWGGGDFFFGEYVPTETTTKNDRTATVDTDGLSEATAEPADAPVKNNQVDALINADTSLTPAQRQELLNGDIVSLFSTIPSGAVRQRHPKDRLVSYHHLRTYACMIDSVTKCPLIHVELKSALQQGWLPEREIAKLETKPRIKERPPDPYNLTPEQIARANEILASRRKPAISQPRNVKITASRRQGARKEVVQVGGGRYEV